MPLEYRHGGKVAGLYGIANAEKPDDNGDEYKLFLHIVGLFNDAAKGSINYPVNVSGVSNPVDYLERRFFGQGKDYFILPEKTGIDGFPDIVLIRDSIVILMDHFKVDASRQIEDKRGRNVGTEYERLCGDFLAGKVSSEEFASETGNITFTAENFRNNLIRSLQKKNIRTSDYKKAFTGYQSQFGDEVAQDDLGKDMEYWLLIENITPRKIDEQIRPISPKSVCPSFDGLIFVENPIVGKMPTDIDQIVFICELKNWN